MAKNSLRHKKPVSRTSLEAAVARAEQAVDNTNASDDPEDIEQRERMLSFARLRLRQFDAKNKPAEVLDEAGAGMARVLKHMNKPFAVISAFTGDNPKDNLKQTHDLLSDLKALRMGGIRMQGHWEGEGGYVSDEISYFIPFANFSGSLEQFDRIMEELGVKYDQEAIVLSNGENISLSYMAGGRDVIGDVATMAPDALMQSWSKVKNQRYKFASRADTDSFADHTRLA